MLSQRQSLDEIGLKHRTDKASKSHDYLSLYEIFFSPLRDNKLKILEIGVFDGASLSTWEEYFPNAQIVGVDVRPGTKRFERGRVSIELVDQSNLEELVTLGMKYGPFDIIIDDGSHKWEHQITSLRTMFPFLVNNGIYIVEDLHTNYGRHVEGYKGVASISCVEYLKKWVDLRVGHTEVPTADVEDAFLRTYGRGIQFISFFRQASLIKKQVSTVNYQRMVGSPLVTSTASQKSNVPVKILAHVGRRGELYGASGFVNPDTESNPIQGLALHADGDLLEYRVCGADQAWGAWTSDNQFVGSRSKSTLLHGITVRVREDVASDYSVRVAGRFVDSNETIEVKGGEDCLSKSGTPLCGIHIVLTSKAKARA